MDEGWTRLVFDTYQIPFSLFSSADLRIGKLPFDVLILPSQSEASLSREITALGLDNLREFIAAGGKLICFDNSCDLAIKTFDLPVKNGLEDLKTSEFYNPGSVVRFDVNTSHPLARTFESQSAAYFIKSGAFEITYKSRVESIAKYAQSEALLSGWMLGEKYLNGKTALAQTSFGAGKIVLFAFRPQHRGQTFATFPFIFNALER